MNCPNFAVLAFPGLNREDEAVFALERNQMRGEIFLWNEKPARLKKYDGFIIPGGFSYEDRIRAGVIAAKDRIMDALRKFAANGKIVLGICNGAQILIESGIVPFATKTPALALARNRRMKDDEVLGTGFYNTWVYVKNTAPQKETAFNLFPPEQILHIPIAHGEGRFLGDAETLKEIQAQGQNVFSYCTEEGKIEPDFPTNPNGAALNLAGVTNLRGNALAFMPHPETYPNGDAIFQSMRKWLESPKSKVSKSISPEGKVHGYTGTRVHSGKLPEVDFVLMAELIITDNEKESTQNCLRGMGFKKVELKKERWWGIKLSDNAHSFQSDSVSPLNEEDSDAQATAPLSALTPHFNGGSTDIQAIKAIAEKILRSGELINLEKEIATLQIGDRQFCFDKTHGWRESASSAPKKSATYLVREREDVVGLAKCANLKHREAGKEIAEVYSGVLWEVAGVMAGERKKIEGMEFLGNVNASEIFIL
jgi:phosphoribosylformylglycinamidine synthase